MRRAEHSARLRKEGTLSHDERGMDPLAVAFRRRVLAGIKADLARESADADGLRAAVVPRVMEAVQAARASGFCRRVWLFGSFAWGQPGTRSDVDLLVEGCRDPDGLAADIWRYIGRPVHVLDLSGAPQSLIERVEREGQPL
jgi:predicted nucleotidyltransferase